MKPNPVVTPMRTKKEVIDALAERTQQSKIDTEAFLDALAEAVCKSLTQGNEAVLPGIGKLTVKERPARTGRNPATGEPIQIAARKAPAFSAAKALKDAVGGS
jgi:DNA-binding protein HU-beta